MKGSNRDERSTKTAGNNSEKIIGFQRLFCKNPKCHYLLKTFYFLENWQIKINGSRYYLCPECNAKNNIVLQGEKIFLIKLLPLSFAIEDTSNNN
jgi:Zn finger protein HypA/HybF involved in hydrogenase expression